MYSSLSKKSIEYTFIVLLVTIIHFSCRSPLPERVKVAYTSLPDKVSYNQHIKPILSDRCYTCHGPDKNTLKAGLRLDIEAEAFKLLSNGNRAFVKGSASKSQAIHRMVSDKLEERMPPPESELSLTDREIALIAKWLDQGAKWEPHWAFMPVKSPEIPELKNEWVAHNEIDHFILRELEQIGLSPSPEADKERLIKRVTMDLTGLPPTLEDIQNFVSDPSPDAYEKIVDRLLASPHHAERMAMEWMDVARYADSQGISFDGYRNSWPYREWLIRAFSKNVPYDEFITHQVAGDLIENSDKDSKLATTFYRLNPLEVSQGSIPEEFRMEYVSERTGLTGTAFLGLTVECAKCHDHKYDPISQKEFYELSAFFNTTEEMGLGPTDKERAPTMLLYKDGQKAHLDSIDQKIWSLKKRARLSSVEVIDLEKYINQLDGESKIKGELAHFKFDEIKTIKKEKKSSKKKKKKEYEDIKIIDNNKQVEASMNVTIGPGYSKQAVYFDGEYDFVRLKEMGMWDHYNPFSAHTWIHPESTSSITTQTIMGNSQTYIGNYRGWDFAINKKRQLHVRLIHRLPDDYIQVTTNESIELDEWTSVGFTYDGSRKAEGISIYINGEKQPLKIDKNTLKRSIASINSYNFKKDTIPLLVGKSFRNWTMDKGLFKGYIDEVTLFEREISAFEMAIMADLELKEVSKTVKEEHILATLSENVSLKDSLLNYKVERAAIVDSIPEIMVMAEMDNPRKTFLLDRGLYDQHLEEVSPGGIEKVLPYSDKFPKNRLGLAQWLTHPDNPLVSRVAVNRYWQMIFGRGLVATAEDFGSQGSRPSHPHLLDYLAHKFVENGWDTRALLKEMVMSATYRQTSFGIKDPENRDPLNIYLSRSNSYRWPAEFIRDNVLAASGLINQKIGGPSVKPYQPTGLWKELDQTSYQLRVYHQDSSADSYRRTLYTFARRFAPHPFLNTFDAPSREICEIKRDITNSPLQALLLLNDPQVMEASRVLAERIQLEACDPLPEKIQYAFKLATGLTPSDYQIDILENQFTYSMDHFGKFPDKADSILLIGLEPPNPHLDKVTTASLTMVTNTIFNYQDAYMKR